MAEFFPGSYWAADFWQELFWPSIGVTYPGMASMAVAAASPSIGFTAGTPAITIQGV